MQPITDIVRMLTDLGERQGVTAAKAGRQMERLLKNAGVPYQIDRITTAIPRGTSRLLVDGTEMESVPTSMKSGTITNSDALASSLIPSRYLIDVPNINFNPRSPGLSVTNLYFAPALAVRTQDVPRLLNATSIVGTVRVTKTRVTLPQILVGNRKNPAAIVFSHYDSIGGPGAIDNASGTAVCLQLCLTQPALLANNLFVFDPNEECSYDYPTYWGHGYRAFAKRYANLMKRAKRLLIVDSVGNGKPQAIRDPAILNLAFPVPGVASLSADVVTIGGDIENMMEVYQSELDTPDLVSEKYLQSTLKLALTLL